jgi:hypothetical protein
VVGSVQYIEGDGCLAGISQCLVSLVVEEAFAVMEVSGFMGRIAH